MQFEPGGLYSLVEAVSNPVHTERSVGCAGIETTTPTQLPGGQYLCKEHPTLKVEIPKASTFGKKLKTLAEKYCAR